MIMNDLKISLEMKNKDWLSIEKMILKSRIIDNAHYINIFITVL